MSTPTIDVLTRRAALALLAAAGLSPLPEQHVAQAGKRKGKRKTRKKQRSDEENAGPGTGEECPDRCLPQVDSCKGFLAPACAGSPTCPSLTACCEAFRTCNAAEFISCLVEAIQSGNAEETVAGLTFAS